MMTGKGIVLTEDIRETAMLVESTLGKLVADINDEQVVSALVF
jgi:hypothetical protein